MFDLFATKPQSEIASARSISALLCSQTAFLASSDPKYLHLPMSSPLSPRRDAPPPLCRSAYSMNSPQSSADLVKGYIRRSNALESLLKEGYACSSRDVRTPPGFACTKAMSGCCSAKD